MLGTPDKSSCTEKGTQCSCEQASKDIPIVCSLFSGNKAYIRAVPSKTRTVLSAAASRFFVPKGKSKGIFCEPPFMLICVG